MFYSNFTLVLDLLHGACVLTNAVKYIMTSLAPPAKNLATKHAFKYEVIHTPM